MATTRAQKLMEGLVVLVADSNLFTRRLIRTMLNSLGARAIHEASDGISAIEAIRTLNPDVMILDWDMAAINGQEVMRIVRSPGAFPKPNLPVIMLTDGRRSRVYTAMRLGVHELLVKPISPKMLQQRMIGILLKPRPMIRAGRYYIPMPRRRPDFRALLNVA